MTPYKRAKKKEKSVLKVSVTMLDQMLAYCDWAEESGTYYGNQAHFLNRHKRVVAWLSAIREKRMNNASSTTGA